MADNICGAKTRAGKPCNNKPIAGKKRCRLHGGLSTGPSKGSKNNLKHGMYSRIFTDEQLDEAQAMQGDVSRELAIARIQLVNCLNHRKAQGDTPQLDEIKDETLADEEDEDVVKKARAKDAQRCGEYYDPDEDDYGGQESEPLKRTRVYRARDWANEEARLINLIAKLEMQLVKQQISVVELEQKKKEVERVSKIGEGEGKKYDEMTDGEIDEQLLKLIRRKS
ncbi:HGGxSTG domain-containing protein [Psychrobacter vallis]|uniref:HGGxSTG domain-containing protein n=1 Tax=Psychrobacter vallis TaxID=248451 RepID=UPI0019197F01|nr:HGGxSTG domain-containing protein [Psychrobacter vallis]